MKIVKLFAGLFVCLFAYTTKLLLIDDLVLSGLGILEKKGQVFENASYIYGGMY